MDSPERKEKQRGYYLKKKNEVKQKTKETGKDDERQRAQKENTINS